MSLLWDIAVIGRKVEGNVCSLQVLTNGEVMLMQVLQYMAYTTSNN